MKLSTTAISAAFAFITASLASSASGQVQEIALTNPTLEQITAEPDWIARSPTNPSWLADGSGIKFSQRRPGLVGRDFSDDYLLFSGNTDAQPSKITAENPGPFFTYSGDWNDDRSLRLFTSSGDLFLFDQGAESATQITRTSAYESSAMFLADSRMVFTRFAFTRDRNWFVRNLDSGYEYQAADIQYSDAPKDEILEPDFKPLQQQQRDLFEIIKLEDQRDEMRQQDRIDWRDTDPTRVPGPFYMGAKKRSQGTWLSPSANHMLVATAPKDRKSSKSDQMPNYVTDDGYVSSRSVRAKVGTVTETPAAFHLLNLKDETIFDISFDDLPMITDDPLAWLKETEPKTDPDTDPDTVSEKEDSTDSTKPESESKSTPKPRPVSSMGARWSDSGRYAAFMLLSHDNKDRWIVLVDTIEDEPIITTAHHLRDEAWIGWGFNSFGFIPNSDTLYYLSEETGYGHLYTRTPTGTVTQHTQGNFEVRSLNFTHDGSFAYMRTNRTHPGIYELEQLNLETNTLKHITNLGGTVKSYRISPNESQAVITYSNINQPPELYLVHLEPNPLLQDPPVRLTSTTTDEFKNTQLQTPQIIPVPSSHTEHPIYTRLYLPDATKFAGPRPLVVFSHGAGYLQHANYEWSNYFREHMFHTILANEGFIVVAPDFRASSGYGRDWRTAIYRNMGYPELEDFKDCIDYAVASHNADPDRVGIYGGSYGGFMTLMAMFLEPETYKAGAALRSVTDWRHYNHGYTSNILNTPDIDPEAYDISSPINFAQGLQGHLLMLHGLQDDNVVAQDIIRLSQRLIELKKQNWELALHPIEPHGYQEPTSWLDQLRRIHKLFKENLQSD